MKNKKPIVLISGANGYLARNLIMNLDLSESVVIALTHDAKAAREAYGVADLEIVEYDFLKPQPLSGIVKSCDVFVNFAWTGIRGEERDNCELQTKNANASVNLAKEAIAQGAQKLIQIGSLAEYGVQMSKVSEDTKPCPITEYGKAKLLCAEKVKGLCAEKDVKFIELRMGSVYGGINDNSIVAKVGKTVGDGGSFMMSTQCSQPWEFIHINDVVNILKKSIFDSDIPSGVYNVSNGDTRPLKDFILSYACKKGADDAVEFGIKPNGLGCFAISTDPAKLKTTFKIEGFLPFEGEIPTRL